MLWLDVYATLLQAMRHGRTDASLITAQTLFDAVACVVADLMHDLLRILVLSKIKRIATIPMQVGRD
jgi:hypothetical protein